jgi:NAD(P)-dependent dehydrogenase (short-subunit alcohol dehydrogenase family)
MSVLAGVRDPDDGGALERESGGRITPIVLDLSRDDSIERAAETVRATVGGNGLFALVNNAASAGRGVPMEYVTREDLERAFSVTTFGSFLLTRGLVPMIRQARGRIVNLGAGRLALPLMGPGFGAKFAMEAMSDILRIELRQTGVRVSIVEPGMTRWEHVDEQLVEYARALDDALDGVSLEDRPRFEGAAAHFKRLNQRMMRTAAPADRVAATIERAITARRPRARYHCGWEQKTVSWLERLTTERVRDALAGHITGL